jgi:hypothetical protein
VLRGFITRHGSDKKEGWKQWARCIGAMSQKRKMDGSMWAHAMTLTIQANGLYLAKLKNIRKIGKHIK